MRDKLTANYQRRLQSGEKYELFWRGAKVSMWDWGSMKDPVGKDLKSQRLRQAKLPKLILPANTGIAFTAKQESEPWPDRPEAETEADFQRANMKEDAWRREQDSQGSPPPSPSPRDPSQRV
jgi:hypothetical protein